MATAAPGTTVTVTTAPSTAGVPAPNTGTGFVAGLTAHGPVGVPILCTSMQDFITLCGPRVGYSTLYDVASLFFSRGTVLYVSRTVGPASTTATIALKDSSAATCLNAAALGAGVDGISISVAVVAGPTAGTYQLVVSYPNATTIVETSPSLVTAADAVAWGTPPNPQVVSNTHSNWLAITAGTSTNAPAVVAAAALTGGADDNSNVTDAITVAALAFFVEALGPGQVAAPGRATATTYAGLGAHAASKNRLAVCDLPDGISTSTAITDSALVQSSIVAGSTDPSFACSVGPWVLWPGIPTGTAVPSWARSVPASAAFMALCAQNDAQNDCNVAAAGDNGILAGALGLSESFDTVRGSLNNAGTCVFRVINNAVTLYGWVSEAVDPNWQDLSSSRFRMQLVADANIIGNNYVFSQIDPQGKVIGAFNGDLTNLCQKYYAAGSIYAFEINTGTTVNTPATIAARQLNAAITLQFSPSAPWVNINLTKYLVSSPLP